MGTSERHQPLNGNWRSSLRLACFVVPMIMFANKMLRGNVFGIPTENDIMLHNLFELKYDAPTDIAGFVGDGEARLRAAPSQHLNEKCDRNGYACT
jgi:hypothetical protein